MTIFDLLFLVVVLVSIAALAAAAISAVRGRRKQALRILKVFGLCAIVYLATGVAVSCFKPQRIIQQGEAWCFDDWCLTLEKVSRTPASSQVSYKLDLRVSSRAGRVAQRAKGAWLYLVDDKGHRYSADADPSATPLDVLLQPQESVATVRVFQVPADVQNLGLITGHGGPYCGPMDILIIGSSGCLFNKPAMIRIL